MKRGFTSIGFMLFLILFVAGGSILFEATQYRSILAEDISKGTLIITPKAKDMISKGDIFLDGASKKGWDGGRISLEVSENDLYRAFIAKVWYERARLEMEVDK